MKRKFKVYQKGRYVEKEMAYIPFRFILAMLMVIIEVISIIAILVFLTLFVPYFYIAIYITVVCIVLRIISKDDNPDYKVPWIITVICLPIVGMMLYFMFSKRVLPKKIIKRFELTSQVYEYDKHNLNLTDLKKENSLIYTQALNICNLSNVNLYKNNNIKYYKCGEDMFIDILAELKEAKEFIFIEYFIIEQGLFWNSILEILKEKASMGVDVKVIYDDIGCMTTLPSNYYKQLSEYNIKAVPFSKLRGTADGEFNNRSHRKIMVIDGIVGFTGGLNIADEYINEIDRFGYWKDNGIRIIGDSVNELTKLFLTDYILNDKKIKEIDFSKYFKEIKEVNNCNNFIIPFGDGPKPIYDKNVGKIAIMNLINHATNYVYISTPYLIIDNEMIRCIENASYRGVDIKILIPGTPDKKIVYDLSKSTADVLIKSNVKVYKYTKGFNHAKTYIADDQVGIIGTMNLDYRSLTHHFENGVWIYNDEVIKEIKEDFINVFAESQLFTKEDLSKSIIKKFIRSIIKIFSPLL